MIRSLALSSVRGNLQRPTSSAINRSATASSATAVYKRTLVSTVLLSRDAYENKKVTELKSELKQRGLATNGKRRELVDRLLESDSRNAKVLPSNDGGNNQIRKLSTKSKQSSAPPSPSEGSVGGTDKATIPHPPDMEPGQVHSNVSDASGGIVVPDKVLEAHPTAPGVPPERAARVPIVFDVKIPYEKILVDAGPEIPLMTGYFHPESPMYEGPPPARDGPLAHVPKVVTIASDANFPGAGVSHHVADFDAHESPQDPSHKTEAADEQSISSAISSMFSSMRNDLGMSVDPAVEKKAVEVTTSSVETTKTLLKEARDNLAARVGSSSGSGSGSASYSTSSYSGGSTRPLNDDEARGLYVLAGIVGGGFLLGGLGKPSKKRIEKVKTEIAEKAQEAKKEIPVLPDKELASLVAKAESALLVTPDLFSVPGKGRAGKAFGDLK